MSEEELIKTRVDKIIELGKTDNETAHVMEDDLYRDIIEAYCPAWVIAEVKRLIDADFVRWYA